MCGFGNSEDKDLSFGAYARIKHKRFSMTIEVDEVVRRKDCSYTTSVHIKPYPVDSDDFVELRPYEIEVPVGSRMDGTPVSIQAKRTKNHRS